MHLKRIKIISYAMICNGMKWRVKLFAIVWDSNVMVWDYNAVVFIDLLCERPNKGVVSDGAKCERTLYRGLHGRGRTCPGVWRWLLRTNVNKPMFHVYLYVVCLIINTIMLCYEIWMLCFGVCCKRYVWINCFN